MSHIEIVDASRTPTAVECRHYKTASASGMIDSREDLSSDRAWTMATTTHPPTDLNGFEGRVLLHNVGWDDYEAMLEIVGERHVRVTYDKGTMEVAMPSQRHEQAAQLFGILVSGL